MGSETVIGNDPTICLPRSVKSNPHANPTIAKLSIFDSYTANFSPTRAVWLFKASRIASKSRPAASELMRSLEATLDSYPHFSGRLRLVSREERDPFTGKQYIGFNRHELWWGDDKRPGVHFYEAVCHEAVEDYVPSPESQASASFLPMERLARAAFTPPCGLADGLRAPSEDGTDVKDEPGMVVQYTAMACGGYALSVSMVHLLGDATSMSIFMRDWSKTHAAIATNDTLPDGSGIFRNELIDQVISNLPSQVGSLEEAQRRMLSLPFNRYDWFQKRDAPFDTAVMHPPPALAGSVRASELAVNAKVPPWEDWDRTAEVGLCVVHLTAAQLSRLRASVTSFARDNPACKDRRMPSTLDIALAHVWAAVNRAKGLSGPGSKPAPSSVDGDRVFANVTVSLRARLRPPLPETFVGNPVAIVATARSSAQAGDPAADVPGMAFDMRDSLGRLERDPDALGAHAYELAREVTPQRIWQCFVGTRHLLATSWVASGMYEVSFGADGTPAYVHPSMNFIEGVVVLTESPPSPPPISQAGTEDEKHGAKWYDNGLNVNLYLKRDVMERLMKDPQLQP